MPTLTVSADDSATAMEEIVQKLGENSYILSTEKTGGKIHIKATNDIKPEIGRPALKRKKAFQNAMPKEYGFPWTLFYTFKSAILVFPHISSEMRFYSFIILATF